MKKTFSAAAILAVMFCTTIFAVSAHSAPCQTLTLALSSDTINYGQPVTLTATISSGTNTGTITFYRHPNAIALGTATVASNEGSTSVVPTVSGSFTITAQYTTSGGNTLVSNSETLTVNPIAITSDFSSSTAWTMSNGILNVTYDPAINAVTQISAVINGSTQTILNHSVADPNIGHGTSSPEIYNVFGATAGATAGPASDSTSSYAVGSNYVDFWTTQPVDSVSTINLEHHYVMYEGFPALVFYVQLTHSSTAGALTDFGDSYIILPSDLNFTSLYYSNYSFTSLGKFSANFPTFAEQYAASQIGNPGCDPSCSGRNVGKETIEYSGLSSISNLYENYVMSSGVSGTIDRNFITKYDYANADEFHNPRGYIGQGGVAEWVVFPTMETHTGGPNQVDLMGVSQGPGMMTIGWASNHLGGSQYTPPQGVDTTRFFGPFVYYFNGTPVSPQAMGTEAALQADATAQMTAMIPLFGDDATMVADGYIPLGSTTQRASTSVTVANSAGWPTTSSYSNLAILSDPNVNFETSNVGYQYWSYINSSGVATFTGIRPGTYRLSVYERGQFGEMRNDGNTFVAGGTSAMANMTYKPETFGTTVWTIGTPDRSAHEFEYGNVPGGGPDLNQFPASYDYWGGLDSSAVQGAVVYYATADGSNPATNNLAVFPYNFWQIFDPNLYAALYDSSDTSDDGYNYVVETTAPYVGGTPSTYESPSWQIHFTTTAAQLAAGSYVEVSIGLVGMQSDLIASLNGSSSLTWKKSAPSSADDPMQRSGVTGYYEWAVLEFPVSDLAAAGDDNVLTLSVNSGWGNMWDALRLQISPTSSNPTVTGWNDYTYISPTTTTLPDDSIDNY